MSPLSFWHSRLLLATLFLGGMGAAVLQPSAQGQDTFTATLSRKDASAEPVTWLSLTNITPGSIIPASSADALCFDKSGVVPLTDPGDPASEVHVYELSNLEDGFKNLAGASPGVALVHWLYDTYYETYFTSPLPAGSHGAIAFQDILWELELDFDGTADSLDFTAGFEPTQNPIYDEHNAMLTGLQSRLGGGDFDTDYRSAKYGIALAKESSLDHVGDQSLIIAWAIPEPTTGLLLTAVGALALRRRRSVTA